MEYVNQRFGPDTPAPASWAGAHFEQCQFLGLDLTNVALTDANFIDCQFERCRLTRSVLKNTQLFDVQFATCQLQYVDFAPCNPFGFHVSFQDCLLDNAQFIGRKLKKSFFDGCSLRETYFVQCDLTETAFRSCNLELAKFEENDLTKADFSTSYNLRLDPDDNKLKRAKFSLNNLPGLLLKYELTIIS